MICAISGGFVASLYVWPESWGPLRAFINLKEAATNLKYYYDRDHPDNIMKRCISIAGVSVLGITYLLRDAHRRATRVTPSSAGLGQRGIVDAARSLAQRHFFGRNALKDIGKAVTVTATLFAGVIATKVFFPSERALLPDASSTESEDEKPNDNASLLRSGSNRPNLGGPSRSPNPPPPEPQDEYTRQNSTSFKLPKEASRELYNLRRRRHFWQIFRNLFFAPVAEEIIFRAVLWSVLLESDIQYPLPVKYAMLAAGFSLAHAHHVGLHAIRYYQNNYDPLIEEQVHSEAWQHGSKITSAQLVMTAVFTVFNTFIYTKVANQNIIAACIAHSVCNYLGPPSLAYRTFLDEGVSQREYLGKQAPSAKSGSLVKRLRALIEPAGIAHEKKISIITVSYVGGIVGFVALSMLLSRRKA